MKINISSIKDVSKNFQEFENRLPIGESGVHGYNYIVDFEVRKFEFEEKDDFSLEVLRALFPSVAQHINGQNREISFDKFQEKLAENFRHTGHLAGMTVPEYLLEIVSDKELSSRMQEFTELMQGIFPYPPEKIYEYIPKDGVDLADALMWSFNFILIDGNEGLVVAAGASE